MIVGAGPIGIMHILMANVFGAGKVIVSEIAEKRAKQALDHGADQLLDPTDKDFREKLMDATDGNGPDNIIIAAPSPRPRQKVSILYR